MFITKLYLNYFLGNSSIVLASSFSFLIYPTWRQLCNHLEKFLSWIYQINWLCCWYGTCKSRVQIFRELKVYLLQGTACKWKKKNKPAKPSSSPTPTPSKTNLPEKHRSVKSEAMCYSSFFFRIELNFKVYIIFCCTLQHGQFIV